MAVQTASLNAPEPAIKTGVWSRIWQNDAPGYLFLLPWLVGFFGLTIGPMLTSLYLSFTDFDLLTSPDWVGADNYIRMFTNDPKFWASMRVTMFFVIFSVPLKLAFALAVAMLLNRGIRGLPLYRALFYLPSLLGASVAIAILWRQIFCRRRPRQQIPRHVRHYWPELDFQSKLFALDAGHPVDLAVRFADDHFLAGLRQIPQDMYEAASLDGASKWRQFIKITLPLLTPVVFFNAIIQTIEAFKSFTPAFIISGGTGNPINSTLFYTLYLYQEAFGFFRMGYASALAWVLLALVGVFTAFSFFTSKYWVHYDD